MADSRSRSRSPPRPKSKSKSTNSSGFRWKEKRPRDEEKDTEQRLERGYRHDRDGYREREKERDRRDRDRDEAPNRRDDGQERRKREKRDTDTTAAAPVGEAKAPDAAPDDDIARKFGISSAAAFHTKAASTPNDSVAGVANVSKPVRAPKPKVATGPMIVVKVNDRLGTTSKIPCLPSDSVGDFKKLVAMQIGRKPHEIMLKRQSERPFKDFLTLEDYGVSDGVQLDLELDTGD